MDVPRTASLLVLLTAGLPELAGADYLPVPFFSQRDPSWSANQLGTCPNPPDSIGDSGCFTTSKAMLFNYYQSGYTDPDGLNDCLRDSGGYTSRCLADWSNADACAPPLVAYQGSESGSLSTLSTSIDAELEGGYPVLADVRWNNDSCAWHEGALQHMVVIIGKSGSTYTIRDPWALDDTSRTLNTPALGSSPYVLCKIHKYHGPVVRVATGDWDGDGDDEVWVYDNTDGRWTIQQPDGALVTAFFMEGAVAGDWPVVGDFDSDGQDDFGVFRPGDNPSRFYLDLDRDASPDWTPALNAQYTQDIPVVGNWDGDFDDDLGVWDSATGIFWLFNLDFGPVLEDYASYQMGVPGDLPVAGNWDGIGGDEVGIFRRGEPNVKTNTYNFRRSDGTHVSLANLGEPNGYGDPGDLPIVGDWNVDGYDTIGVYRPSTQQPYVRDDLPHLSPSVGLPAVSTDPASGIGQTSATLNGTVNPNGTETTALFRYGTDFYDFSTPPRSMGFDPMTHALSETVTGLLCGALYHYRLEAANSSGLALGMDRTFVTAPCSGSPSLQVLSPISTDTWPVGTEQTIQWSASGLSSSVVGLWFWDGSEWSHIADVPSSQTFYFWTVPATSVTEGWIYIWSRVGDVTEADDWSEPFTITPSSSGPMLEITSPAGGEVWDGGSTQTLTWNAANLDPSAVVGLWLYDGEGFTHIADVPPSQTSYDWRVPHRTVEEARIYIWSRVDNTTEVDDWSNGTLQLVGRSPADLDGDGTSDIVWRHTGGALYVWQMNGTGLKDSSFLPAISLAWQIRGFGDFNGDGRADVLWREQSSGGTYLWLMDGATAIGAGYTSSLAGNTWTVEGVGDFDGDGRSDIVWRHSGGALYIWLMDGTTVRPESAFLPEISLAWEIEGIGDFNRDGRSDILWRDVSGGATYLWLMNGTQAIGAGYTSSYADTTWTIEGVGDLDGNGSSDIVWRHSGGALYLWLMDGTAVDPASAFLPPISTAWQIEQVGDFNGDGHADVLWREVASGNTYLWLMEGPIATGQGYTDSQADNTWVIQAP